VQLLIDAARLHNEADLKLLDLAHDARSALATAARSARSSAPIDSASNDQHAAS
jgi:hypothetical protein